jgi:hypothetical protein
MSATQLENTSIAINFFMDKINYFKNNIDQMETYYIMIRYNMASYLSKIHDNLFFQALLKESMNIV